MNRPVLLVLLGLSSCTGLLAGSDRETDADGASRSVADASSPDLDGAPDVVVSPDGDGADTARDSSDGTSDVPASDSANDGPPRDVPSDEYRVDTAFDGSIDDDSAVDASGDRVAGSGDDVLGGDADGGIDAKCTGVCELGSLRCDGATGFVCEEQSGCTAWVQRLMCEGTEMCCPSAGQFACVSPDANHCFSCGLSCAGALPACSAERKTCVCTPTSCAANFGCDDTTGTCVPCTTLGPGATDFYVDTRVNGGGSGSEKCPFRTISEALAVAQGSTAVAKTVHVGAGTYAVETFPLVIRDGITLEGAGADKVIIAGLGRYTSKLPGSQDFLVTAVMGDRTRANTIRGVTLMSNTDPKIAYYGVLCDDGNLATPKGSGPPKNLPNSFLRDVTFGSDYDAAVGIGANVSSQSGGNVQIDNVRFQGSWHGIWAVTCALDSNPLAYGNLVISESHFAGQRDAGITVRGCVSLDLQNSVFEDSAVGLQSWSEQSFESDYSSFRVDGNTFQRLNAHAVLLGGIRVESLSNNTFVNNTTLGNNSAVALRIDSTTTGRKFYARWNRFIGNDIAISFEGGGPTDVNHLLDFGTASDPGRNEFRCNSSVVSNLVRYGGFDVGLEAPKTAGWVFHLAGNQWDHAVPSSQSSPNDRYQTTLVDGVDVFLGNGNTADGIDTSGATHWTGLCPTDHILGPDMINGSRASE